MRSTFFGFEAAKKALNASQVGLNVTGQNIANVNTAGYTRQILDLASISANSGSYMISQVISSAVGQGVEVTGISQVRNQFLDARFRKENAEHGTWNTTLSALQDIENVLDETTNNGLNATLASFYKNLQNLSGNAGDTEFASILRSTARTVTEVLNQYAGQLEEIRDQQAYDLEIVVNDINAITQKIESLNIEIRSQLMQGLPANELLDMRNTYIDSLSGYLNITTESQADGSVSVKCGSTYLIDAENGVRNTYYLDAGTYPTSVKNTDDDSVLSISEGSVAGYLQVLNGKGSYASAGESDFQGIFYYQACIDAFAQTFAQTFNALNEYNGTDKPLFSGDASGNITASTISISSQWLADAGFITTSTKVPATDGSNDNVIRMLGAMEEDISDASVFKGTFEEWATSFIGDIAVSVNFTNDMTKSSKYVLSAITDQRESIMGVSLDEEAVNLIKYQKSFAAAARLMTALDEALEILINNTGRVGR